MIIEPRTRGFICTTAHPTGCDGNVCQMIKYTLEHKDENTDMPKRVSVAFVVGVDYGADVGTDVPVGHLTAVI